MTDKLGIAIHVMTGVLRPGDLASHTYVSSTCDLAPSKHVWLFQHPIADEAGNKSMHFSLVSEVGHNYYLVETRHFPEIVTSTPKVYL